MSYRPIFLMAVLVFGFIGNPFAFSNFDNKLQTSDVGFDLIGSSLGGFAFAQTEDEDEEQEETDNEETEEEVEEEVEEETENEGRDDEERENEAEDEVENEEQENEERETDQIEIEVEIENGIAKVDIDINGEEMEFEMEATDRMAIIEEIALQTGLTVEQIRSVITFEIRESEEIEEPEVDESGKVRICHIPPGNPGKAHTIAVARAAVEAHLAHGDFLGACENDFDEKLKEREAKLTEREARLAANMEEREARLAEKLEEREARLAERQAETEERQSEREIEREARIAERQDKALQRAEDIIQRLEQRIVQLEQRVQTLLERVETGEYFGRTVGQNAVTQLYTVSFDGVASSIFDESVTADVSGEIFLENLPTGSQISKFRVTGGEIVVGENIYDLAFGKARLSSEQNSMVLIGEVIDFEGNQNTLRLTVDLEDGLGSEPIGFEILPQSKISSQWSVSAQGQLSQIES